MAAPAPSAFDRLRRRVLRVLAARSGGLVVFGAADLLAARATELRRLPRLPRAFGVRAVSRDDESALSAFTGEPARVERLLAAGDVGLVAVADGAVQAMEWLRPGPADYDWDLRRLGLVFALPERACWLHNGKGAEDGPGPWAMVMGRLPAFLEECSLDAAYLQVASDNLYSIRCHESLGFRRLARVRALRVGPWRIVRYSAGAVTRTWFGEGRLDLAELPL